MIDQGVPFHTRH